MAENRSGVKEWIVQQAGAAGNDCPGGREPGAVAADDPSAQIAIDANVEKTAVGGSSLTDAERGAGKPVGLQNPPSGSVSRVGKRVLGETGMKSVAAPMRRRSWHQFYRMLEIDAARKKEAR
jgi:hypothetical protein